MFHESGRSTARQARGFTLIELMTTVAVVGILAAVAYPSYQNSVMKSRRTDAKTALATAAQQLERYYTENNTYVGARFCSLGGSCTQAVRVFEDRSENGYYTLAFSAGPTASAYTIAATPVATTPQANDACGAFSLNQSGQRSVSTGTDSSQCW